MLADSGVDWTQVLVALVAGLPATLSVVLAYRIHRQIRTPSGQHIGELTERGTHLAEVNTELTIDMHKQMRVAKDERKDTQR